MGLYVSTYNKLPETIPIHFGLDGKADGFGSKNTNFIVAGIATVIFALMFYLSKNPKAPGLNIPNNLKKIPQIAEFIVSVFMCFGYVAFWFYYLRKH